jgi:2-amino-4-hydroxy-6-hydroxymethyldihydropteridine diphosphokinase
VKTSDPGGSPTHRAYLALGSNLGERRAYLQGAINALARADGVTVIAVSPVYETEPVGGPAQDDYLNAVVAIDTTLDPYALLDLAHECEAEARRVRVEKDGPRTLDVDVLLYDDVELDDPVLTIPHPRMSERGFVLAPLQDIAPERVVGSGPWPGVRMASVTLDLPPTR